MPEIKENFNQYERNDTMKQMQIEQTYTKPSGYIKVFPQNLTFIIVVEKQRKKVSMSEASHPLKFKIVLICIWSSRQFKQNKPSLLKKKRGALWSFKNHIERKA